MKRVGIAERADRHLVSRDGWSGTDHDNIIPSGESGTRQHEKLGQVPHPKLKNDLRRPQMEEIGDRTTVFEFGGLRDRQRDYIDWVLKSSVEEGVTPEDIMTDTAATRLAAKLKTPLQIGQHLVRAFEAGFEIGAKPVDETVVEAVLSLRIDDLEPRLTRSGYDVRSLVEQFDAKPAEIRRLLRGDLDPARSRELMDEMRAAGLPT